jgi:hypothetical protein
MRKVSGVVALLAIAVLATSASAAGPKTFNFKFKLPKTGHGSIYEVKLNIKLPPGARVSGNPFAFNMTNGTSLPGNIRAAYAIVPKGGGKWDIFVAINALKGRGTSSAASATTLNTSLQASPIGPGPISATASKKDACPAYARDPKNHALYLIFVAGRPDEALGIFGFVSKDDPFCK